MSAVLKTLPQAESPLFEYRGVMYPDYLKHGNACQFITPIAKQFCHGVGIDIGAGEWPFLGACPHDIKNSNDAEDLPINRYSKDGLWDFAFSSHCLEHLVNPVAAIEHWKTRLRSGGVVFLYLPHPSQRYWNPANCRKHLHLFHPEDVATMLRDLGFINVIHSERDMAWSFSACGWNP